MNEELESPPTTKGPLRWCWLTAGVGFTALAILGVFLPVLPTTPFLLVAAACFSRSSPAFHRALLGNRIFGPYIHQWERERTVPPEAKRKAYILIVVTFSISAFVVSTLLMRVVLVVTAAGLICFLRSLPAAPGQSEV